MFTIKLSKEITTPKGVVNQIEFRDISAHDMVTIRTAPFYFVNVGDETIGPKSSRKDQRFEVRLDIAMQYLAAMSGFDKTILYQLRGRDYQKMVDKLIEVWSEAEGESEDGSKISST